ncbi:MAG: hypothetical protein DYG96_13070 [Chlorobi bacterium CHB2]|nr:hypothetical protein [Chlorobi bacterium CHB2]
MMIQWQNIHSYWQVQAQLMGIKRILLYGMMELNGVSLRIHFYELKSLIGIVMGSWNFMKLTTLKVKTQFSVLMMDGLSQYSLGNNMTDLL